MDQRTHKRRLLIIADLVRAGVLLSLPVAYLFDAITLTQLYLVALLTGLGAVLFAMARQRLLRRPGAPIGVRGRDQQAEHEPVAVLHRRPRRRRWAGPGAQRAGRDPRRRVVVPRLRAAAPPHPGDRAPPPPRQTSTLGRSAKGSCWCCATPCCGPPSGCTSTVNFFTFITGALLVLYASRDLDLSAGAIGSPSGSGHSAGSRARRSPHGSPAPSALGRTAMIGAVLFPAPLALTALA